MKPVDMNHLPHLEKIAMDDVSHIERKEATYRGSWKARGGTGAFMMMARKWDRLDNMMEDTPGYDIFAAIARDMTGADGTALAEVRDLRRYLLLVEAEMVARASATKVATTLYPVFTGVPTAPVAISMNEISAEVWHRLRGPAADLYELRSLGRYRLRDFFDDSASEVSAQHPELARYIDYIIGCGKFMLDRTALTEEEREQRRRWPIEVNVVEHRGLPAEVQVLYNLAGDGGYRMAPYFVYRWGQKP